VAHKSGTGGTNYGIMTSATNDVGIITLPNGQHLALVVFVSDYTSGAKNGEAVIAKIARAAYDHAMAQ
jgi:beta-lactamase class A